MCELIPGEFRQHTTYFIPDVLVAEARYADAQKGTRALEVFKEPLPLVVEVWSKSTADYDVTEKLAEYKRRADLEVWLIHPYEKMLTAWVKQADGSYTEQRVTGGLLACVALPGVSIDFDLLFSMV